MTDNQMTGQPDTNNTQSPFEQLPSTDAVPLLPEGGLAESGRLSAQSHTIAVSPGDLDQQGWSKGRIGAFDQPDASSQPESVEVLVEPVGSGALTAIVSWRQAPRPIATQLAVLLTAS